MTPRSRNVVAVRLHETIIATQVSYRSAGGPRCHQGTQLQAELAAQSMSNYAAAKARTRTPDDDPPIVFDFRHRFAVLAGGDEVLSHKLAPDV